VLTSGATVYLIDVDNTLLDNDRFLTDLGARLEQSFGTAGRDRYWQLYAAARAELGYADYLATLQRFRVGHDDDPALLQMSAFLLEYPFADRLYPRALEVVAYLHTLGQPAILSDGDVIFQPRKIQRSGIWDAVNGRVMIYVHKELMLESMQRRFPASHYVMIDDKPQLLAKMKQVLGERLTTVFVRQGHYAHEVDGVALQPAPDQSIDHIGDLLP
jgi:FMN phosphatase YigB (HAD superfamily)